jgi:hypothetical protein
MKRATIILIIFLASAVSAAVPAEARALSSAYLLGLYGSYNIREGYRKFDDLDEFMHVGNTNPFIIGGVLGKRFPLENPRLRTQIALEGGWGSVKDMDHIGYTVHSVYGTYGAIVDAHLLFPYETHTLFLTLGIGAHLTYYHADWREFDGRKVEDMDINKRRNFSPSIGIGLGTEHRINPKRMAAIVYNFRILQSARYTEIGLFPMGADYREFFYSHTLQLQFLLPESNRGGWQER